MKRITLEEYNTKMTEGNGQIRVIWSEMQKLQTLMNDYVSQCYYEERDKVEAKFDILEYKMDKIGKELATLIQLYPEHRR